MSQSQATSIFHYDVVIIGGGIAGIAVAELLARRTDLSIMVVEQAPKLGMGASGKLEGWFHSGALYSAHDDAQTFLNCLNSIEDLINIYGTYFTDACNLRLVERREGFFSPGVFPESEGWFNASPVFLIHPRGESPDIRLSRFRNDRILLEIQRKRVRNRLEAAFGQRHNWLQDGNCRAPSYENIERSNPRVAACSLADTPKLLKELFERFDRSFDLPPSEYDTLKSQDVSINTARVLRDLVSSAVTNGVDFETNLRIENLVSEKFGPVRIKALLCRNSHGESICLKANLFIFTVGEGFEPYLNDLNVRVRLKKSQSAMVMASPPLFPLNFARMSIKEKFHFNHLLHQGHIAGKTIQYSMLANSDYYENEDMGKGQIMAADSILDLGERLWGAKNLYQRKLYTYSCTKTEFISQEEEKRRYSYWIESNPQSNHMCILPGKFSFFPTLAYQSYLRIKQLLDTKDRSASEYYTPRVDSEKLAEELVAEHYPLRILADHGNLKLPLNSLNSFAVSALHKPNVALLERCEQFFMEDS